MENKIYIYNNNSYNLKPITLAVLASAAPVMAKFRKLQQKYTSDINLKQIESAKKRISELETGLEQLKQNSYGQETEENTGSRIEELEQKLQNAKEQFDNDYQMQSVLKLYNECLGLAMLELMGEGNLIKPFLGNVLQPVEGNSADINIDLHDPDAVGFTGDVVRDFFGLIAGYRKKSAG